MVPSILCALYFIYNTIKIRSFRKRFQNQTLIILVCIILLDIVCNLSITLSFYGHGSIGIKTKFFCELWEFLDYAFTALIVWYTAIFTLERYMLVFYSNLLRSPKQKLIFHYVPLITITVYLFVFYLLASFVIICLSTLNYNKHLCGTQCLDQQNVLSTFNWLFNILFPVSVVIVGSFLLLIHVLWKRREMQRNLGNWSKNWKMIVQLLGIAIVYVTVWGPLICLSLFSIFFYRNDLIDQIEHYMYFTSYLCDMITPIVAVFLAPELMQKLRGRTRPSTIDIGSVTIRQYSNN
ncbi:unnamed protein product [Rotaria socialis]|uniref:G-protein coupled receptors family 1 profile domain-containing protein n=1 Tax=Rotaria socialis TaxID=392032 RepID=A0A817ZHJ0_9BILA|nr:unnamed protein product [Rotaria socialis]CAF4506741.1 unnamed protein product [Rotaria socialis]